ncbi:MAG: efflux transporter outer membrane subunit [Gemmatimonadota bacterium]
MRSAPAIGAALTLACGCNFAPAHVRPALPTPEAFPAEYAGDSTPGTRAPGIGWRDFIEDPRLEALVGTALTKNRDLAIAVARIEEARGLYRIQRAERLPTVDVNANATKTHIGANAGSGVPAGATAATFESYSVGAGVSIFELDFWGRVRNLSDAARSQFLATVQAQRAFRLSLIRDVASTYLASVEAAEQIRLAEATVESRREGLRIAQVRFDAGITSALEYRQAESLLTQAETDLAGLRLTKARSENALAVLVGGPAAGDLPDALPLARQASAITLAAGLPSELLVARPDIIGAEEQLRAADANIGAARAAFFPSISLTGSLGFASAELGHLISSGSKTWSFGPSLNVPIFNLGRSKGNLIAAKARQTIAIASYERVIQTAFQEVSDALAGRRYLAEQVAAQERGTMAQRQIAELARIRYNEGVVSYLEVLDAERNLFAAEQTLLQLRRAEAENLIALYVVLGGGAIERQ